MSESIKLKISNDSIQLNSSASEPIYVGARAYVEQINEGALIICEDKLGKTTALLHNGGQGEQGEQGIGIANAFIDEEFRLNIVLTNEETWTSPEPIKGEQGEGISNIIFNDDYTLTIEYGDGEVVTTASIRGEKGENGERGAVGEKGEKGESYTITTSDYEEIAKIVADDYGVTPNSISNDYINNL